MELGSFRKFQCNYWTFPLFYCFSILCMPVIVTVYIVLKGVKSIIHYFLQIKYGSLYGGLVQGGDSVFTIENKGKSVISFVIFIQHSFREENFSQRIRLTLLERFTQYLEAFPKLHCVQHKFGFSYLKKNQIDISNCITIFSNFNNTKEFTQSELEKYISIYFSKPLPQKDKALWEIIIFSKPMELYNHENVIPILCRFHHVVGDGLALTRLMEKVLQSDEGTNDDNLRFNIHEIIKSRDIKKTKVLKIRQVIHNVLMAPLVISHQTFFRIQEDNIFYKKNLSGEKIIAYTMEETSELISKVKKIKSSIPKLTFTDILLTAVYKTLYAGMKKVCLIQTQYIYFRLRYGKLELGNC